MTTTGESLEIKKAARVKRVWEKKDTHFLLHFFKRCGEGDDDYDDDFFSFGESTLTEDDDDAPYDDADANEVLVLARRKKSSRRSKRLLRRDYESHHAEKRGGDSRGKSAQKVRFGSKFVLVCGFYLILLTFCSPPRRRKLSFYSRALES